MSPSGRESGQATVEAAITLPMMIFTLLSILQMTVVYHARLAAEYAAFKAARAGSVYRLDCGRMVDAALMALMPTLPGASNARLQQRYLTTVRQVLYNNRNRPPASAVDVPLVLVDYAVTGGRGAFDEALEPGVAGGGPPDEPMKLHVRVAYFYEYRIPYANWILTRFWLASHGVAKWFATDPIMLVKKRLRQPPVIGGGSAGGSQLAQIAAFAGSNGYYTTPLVTSWSMRMMSDPLPGAPLVRQCR